MKNFPPLIINIQLVYQHLIIITAHPCPAECRNMCCKNSEKPSFSYQRRCHKFKSDTVVDYLTTNRYAIICNDKIDAFPATLNIQHNYIWAYWFLRLQNETSYSTRHFLNARFLQKRLHKIKKSTFETWGYTTSKGKRFTSHQNKWFFLN